MQCQFRCNPIQSELGACALTVSALKVWMFGFDTQWLIFFGWSIRVMLFDRAVAQGRWIKRHFVFFSSLALSAKTSSSEQGERETQTEGDGNRQKNRPGDGAADRQVVEQSAVLDWACKYLGHSSSTH